MFKNLIREHARRVAEVHALEQRLHRERAAALAALPEAFGFADLGSFIRAVKGAAKPSRRRKAVHTPSKSAPKTIAAKASRPAPPPPAHYPGLAAAKAPETANAALPAGTSLDDPANFGLLPHQAVLERGNKSADAYVEDLSKALRFAQKVLHTSKVHAAIWLEWRQFERAATLAIQTTKDGARGDSPEEWSS